MSSIVRKRNNNMFYFIGRYDIRHKGLDCLLDALDLLEKKEQIVCVNFWGSGDGKSLEYLRFRVRNYKNVKVQISSPIYGETKDRILEQYGPMLLTSRYEGFPMTILEAWSYGNPCLVTPGTNVSNEVKSNSLGWSVDLDAEAIATGILLALEDYIENREEYSRRCKEYVRDNYSWETIAKLSYKEIDETIRCQK